MSMHVLAGLSQVTPGTAVHGHRSTVCLVRANRQLDRSTARLFPLGSDLWPPSLDLLCGAAIRLCSRSSFLFSGSNFWTDRRYTHGIIIQPLGNGADTTRRS